MAKYNLTNNTFVNPYNFVPLGKEIKKANIEEVNNNPVLSGVIKCTLTAKTPLAIPGEGTKTEKEHMVYKALRNEIDNTLMIPGSSIRGVIRSEYETVTNSCLLTVDEDEHITTRAGAQGAFQPALIIKEDGEYSIYKAERIPLVSTMYRKMKPEGNREFFSFDYKKDSNRGFYIEINNNKLFLGDEVSFEANGPGHKKKDKKTGNITKVWDKSVSNIDVKDKLSNSGYLYIGEKISNKHADGVFVCKDKLGNYSDKDIRVALDAFANIIDAYNDSAINRNLEESHNGYPGYKKIKDMKVIPVWYDSNSAILKLSPAAIGRSAYHNSMEDLIANHSRCHTRKNLCPACALFGMVGKKAKTDKSLGSKIRITDAYAIGEVKTSMATLKELGAPRSSYLRFYSDGGKGYDDEGAKIRGRKYYWHIPEASTDAGVYSTREKNNRNSTMELISPNSTFEFQVYFDSITEKQLNTLEYVLMSGDNENLNMHKIGHGKPLGLGSAKVVVDSVFLKNSDDSLNNYSIDVEKCSKMDIGQTDVDEECLKEFAIISNLESVKSMNVRYPYVEGAKTDKELKDNVLASHQWFKRNKKVLPDIRNVESKRLTSYIADSFEENDFIDNNNKKKNSNKIIEINQTTQGKVVEIEDKKVKIDCNEYGELKVHVSKIEIGKKPIRTKEVFRINDTVIVKRLKDNPEYGAQYSIIEKK